MASEARKDEPVQVAASTWLTTRAAAVYCGCSPSTLQKHIERGNLVPDSWGKRGRFGTHRFLRATLDAFIRGESPREQKAG